jgi:acetylornithine/succinyldiaminopimelate/putrescine aminotransferase
MNIFSKRNIVAGGAATIAFYLLQSVTASQSKWVQGGATFGGAVLAIAAASHFTKA